MKLRPLLVLHAPLVILCVHLLAAAIGFCGAVVGRSGGYSQPKTPTWSVAVVLFLVDTSFSGPFVGISLKSKLAPIVLGQWLPQHQRPK